MRVRFSLRPPINDLKMKKNLEINKINNLLELFFNQYENQSDKKLHLIQDIVKLFRLT